jgi:hypothetical protein
MGFRYLEGSDYPEEFDGLGSRRRYFVSSRIEDDYAAAAALIEKHYYGRGV